MVKPNHPHLANLETHLAELEQQGYTLFPAYLDRSTTAAIRALIDQVAGPVRTDATGSNRRDLRHPIPGSLMPRLVNNPETLELAATLIGSRDLRLREQVFIRSDPSAPPYPPHHWHIDAAFCRTEFEAQPRQVYYQMLHCCSTVQSGGAAFMIVPGSHKLSLDKSESEQWHQHPIPTHTAPIEGVGEDEGIEICPEDGDLIVFNPLCYHSATPNRRPEPRYVYFSSFYHPSATRLIELLHRTEYRDNFSAELRQGLPKELQTLLEY